MTDRFDEETEGGWERPARSGRRRHRSKSRRRRSLTPEENAYRLARRRANAKLRFVTHFVTYLAVCTFLLFVAGFRPAFITALGWGIGLVIHYFAVLVAPGLRVGPTDTRHDLDLAENRFRLLSLRIKPDDTKRCHGTDEQISISICEEIIRFHVLSPGYRDLSSSS